MKKKLILYTFNILTNFVSFSWQIIHFKNINVYTFFEGEEVWDCVCFVHSIKC